jgi:hypothetical protein
LLVPDKCLLLFAYLKCLQQFHRVV